MRDSGIRTSDFELLPTNLEHPYRSGGGAYQEIDNDNAAGKRKFYALPGVRHILYSIPLVLAVTPVALLLALSPHFSRLLGYNGCTPSGDFVLPYTSSIWNSKGFFAITIAFTHIFINSDCDDGDNGSPSGSQSLACSNGYSFTQVKVIDIAWDVLVGRGGQAALTVLSYRLFSRVVKALMEQGEVGYGVFSAVAFNPGSLGSFITLAKSAVGRTPLPRTRHAIFVYSGMALATMYIVTFPSLLGAMTGYTSFYAPFVDHVESYGAPQRLQDCTGTISPAWGRVEMVPIRVGDYFASIGPPGYWAINLDHPPYDWYSGPEWIDYYDRYRSVYDACPRQLNISNCAEAQQKTYLMEPFWQGGPAHNLTIPAPMPGIVLYPSSSDPQLKYSHWSCGDEIIPTDHFSQYVAGGSVTGICRAGSGYQWGFSFFLTFIICMLNLLFTLIMYALWWDVHRDGAPGASGVFKDAVTMVTMAQKQYGAKVGEWSPSTLQEEVAKGRVGMTFATVDRPHFRRRVGNSSGQQELGDPLRGDWGGDVVVEDRK